MRLILKIRMGKMLPWADFGSHMIVGFMQSAFNICNCSFVSDLYPQSWSFVCFVFSAHWGKCDSDFQLFLSLQCTDVAFHNYICYTSPWSTPSVPL